MVINPFIKENNLKVPENKLSIESLQKYVINNYIDYLKNDLKEALTQKLEEYICTKYLITSKEEINEIIQKLISKMFGYDILQKYIDDINVSDIRVVKWDMIYIKKKGVWEKTDDRFENSEDFENYIRYIVLKNNFNINFENPIVVVSDKKYNLRIEAGIAPVNISSSSLVIRIHRVNSDTTLESLFLNDEMLDSKSYKIVNDIISEEKNVILSGKGGSGKTTLLREMIKKIPDEKSITISEETSELYIENKNIIQREILENRDELRKITLEKLLKHCLVMSNDVLIVGELKGSETSVFLDAISTGHIGMGTVNSDCAENTIDRLITLVKRDVKCSQYKEEFIEQILASSIDYLIYMENYKVSQISKVSFDKEKSKLKLDIVYDKKELIYG